MSQKATVLGFAGLYLGILGIIFAASAPAAATLGMNGYAFAIIAWMVGLLLIIAAYSVADRPG